MNKKVSVRKLVLLALFTAIIAVLQFMGAAIKLGGQFSVSLVLVPIVVGAALCGPAAGAYLGGVFGVVVLLSGDAALFMAISPLGAILTVMAKGILSGFAAGMAYKLIKGKKESSGAKWAATIAAGAASPIVNTGIFLLGCIAFFMGWLRDTAAALGFESWGTYMVVGLTGMNFVFELVVNLVLSSVIVRLIDLGTKTLNNNN